MYVIRMGWQGLSIRPSVSDGALNALVAEANRLLTTSPIVTKEPSQKFAEPAGHAGLGHTQTGWSEVRGLGFHQPAIFRAHWPQKNQEIFSHTTDAPVPNYQGPVVEDFTIIYGGWVYVVAGHCDQALPSPYSFVFGREAARIIQHIFSRGTELDVFDEPLFGPTPMFPVSYLCISDDPVESILGRAPIGEFDTLESVHRLPTDTKDEEKSTVSHMRNLVQPVHAHYDDLDLRNRAIKAQLEFESSFSEAAACFEGLMTPAGWSPVRRMRQIGLSREMRRLVGRCYMRYASFQEQRGRLVREARETEGLFAKNSLLYPHKEYAREIMDDVLDVEYAHVSEAVKFLGDESRSRGLEGATVQAAAAWALLGIVAVWALSELFS